MIRTPPPRLHITRARSNMGGVIFIGRRFDDAVLLVIYAMIALCAVCIALLAIAHKVTA